MKHCSSCNLTFDDAETFCSKDGTRLTTASYAEPQPTMMATPQQQQPSYTPTNHSPQYNQSSQPQWPQQSMPSQQMPPTWGGQHTGAPYIPSPGPATQRRKGLAVMSLAFGIVSIGLAVAAWFLWNYELAWRVYMRSVSPSLRLLFYTLVGSLVLFVVISLIFGLLALLKAKNNPAQHGGKGIAVAGLAAGSVSALGLLVLLGLYATSPVSNSDVDVSNVPRSSSSSSDTSPTSSSSSGLSASDTTRIAVEVREKILLFTSTKDSFSVKVDRSGTVTLKGSVTTYEKKRMSENAARDVQGVSRVDNQLTVSE